MSELAALIAELVEIDSVNPDLVAGGAGEGQIARFVAGWLGRAGLEVALQETAPGRPNVIGRVRGQGTGKSLMLNAHMDTVGLSGTDGGLQARIDGDRLYGRGAFDMKASLAAMMLAGAELARRPPAGDVLITAVTDEEYASIGTEAIVREYRADAAVVTEPTDLELCLAHKGFAWAEIETSGVAAHGSQPESGVDAIVKMGHMLVALDGLDKSLQATRQHHRVGSASLHASLIEGGIELSTYPDRCRLQIERRTVPGETRDSVKQELEELLANLRERDPKFHAQATLGLVREPFEIGESEPIVKTLASVATRLAGHARVMSGTTGWMDSALLDAVGIPTVIYGPIGDGAHAAAEWVDLPSADVCRRVYEELAREFCA
jgi:acetylornithine deacetylase